MKNLPKEQLRKIGIFNTYDFVGPKSWFVSYRNFGGTSRGWALIVLGKQALFEDKIVCFTRTSRARPDELREQLEPALQKYGFTWPESWVKHCGDWVPKDTYERRMVQLVAKYKLLVKQGEVVE